MIGTIITGLGGLVVVGVRVTECMSLQAMVITAILIGATIQRTAGTLAAMMTTVIKV
jgi:hypothetical protein